MGDGFLLMARMVVNGVKASSNEHQSIRDKLLWEMHGLIQSEMNFHALTRLMVLRCDVRNRD